ncbi:hypothetical protein IAR55_000929 [Kwoniella newhampshirensis]|uniref:Dynamin-type G domain-containing protein n=1 Tax=Kwoniella newhampshirensis TaxID=1651941 RepID=A0AAW0Z4A7_9TREE
MLRRLPVSARPYLLNRTRPLLVPRPAIFPPSRQVHVRAISFSSIPRAMARAFRVPLYGAAIGAGGVGYANYKLEGVRNATSEILTNVSDKLSSAYNSATDGISAAADIGSQLGSTIQGRLSDTAAGVQDSADSFAQGTKEWWEAFTSQFTRSQDSTSSTSAGGDGGAGGKGREEKWQPGEGPGEPNRNNGGEEALLGLVGAVAAANVEEKASDPFIGGGGDEHQLLQLTRKLIEIRSVLLSVDQSDALKLPSIVVIGSQSSGKSSVLEAIVGHEFLPK